MKKSYVEANPIWIRYSELWNMKCSDYISFSNKICLETVACPLGWNGRCWDFTEYMVID